MRFCFTSTMCLLNRRLILIFLCTTLFSNRLLAQISPFQHVTEKADSGVLQSVKPYFVRVRLYTLDVAALRQTLRNAPLEGQRTSPGVGLTIPMPDGSLERFELVETALLAPAIARQFPAIKTYSGNGQTDTNKSISISLTPAGFNAIILSTTGSPAYIENIQGTDQYRSYYAKDARLPQSPQHQLVRPQCSAGVMGIDVSAPKKTLKGAKVAATIGIGNNTVGTRLRTFRLAAAATGEFTRKHGGQAQAFNDLVAYINRVNAVYKKELSVGFQLVSGTNLVFPDPATDPYQGNDANKPELMQAPNQTTCDAIIGDANYDLGFVVSATYPTKEGVSSSGGGIAATPSLGEKGDKAQNAMYEGDWAADGTSYSQLYTDQVFAHEIGHQFGMQHTFNSNLGSCAGNGSTTGNVEPGAGVTIMSYGYTCSSKAPTGDDNYGPEGLPDGPILNFHAGSFALATQYMATIPDVGVTSSTGNTPPVVTVPTATYTIPKSTPFALTGSATDTDNDALTYSWEGIDIGATDKPDASVFTDPTKPPFFRSYAPSATGNARTYPILSAILAGTNAAKGEKLPAISFATTHRLTVRDNSAKGGGVVSTDVTVTIDGNTGPFLVTNDWQGAYGGTSTQTLTWSVNGTSAATPNVRIMLSTDGGQTFPTVLLASTPNTGSARVTVPNVATTSGRLKVEALGNIFFDISNQDFAITQTTASAPVVSGLSNATTCSGVASAGQTFSVTDNDPSSVSLVASSSNPNLVPAENVLLTGSGTTRSVVVTPVSGQSGTVVITLTATNSTNISGSASFTLSVTAAPVISSGPASVTINAGQSTRLSTAATGDNLSYQWQVNAGVGFSAVTENTTYSGVNSATLAVASATTALTGYQYRVLISSGSCSTLSASATLTVNPARPDLTPTLYARPSTLSGTREVTVVVDVAELVGLPTNGPLEVRLTRDANVSLRFSSSVSLMDGRSVQNRVWQMDDSNADYYILRTTQVIGASDKLSFGLSGQLAPGATSGSLTVSAVIVAGSGGEARLNNNVDADKIDYFQP